jgi:inosine-uridine nucleoside N-ribohydrolase
MKAHLIRATIALTIAALAGAATPATRAETPAEPVRLIFDTDICGDCDDVLALAMIHSLETRGACKLLAVTVSVDEPQAAPFVDAVNTFFGRGDVPIGVPHAPAADVHKSAFLKLADVKDDGQYRFPHDLITREDAQPAVPLLRRTLAAQPDGSVVIAQVGFSTNLARLLESKADDISPLSGVDLVKRKVRLLSIMAGSFGLVPDTKRHLEYNVILDIPSFRTLTEKWPTDVVFSGFEIGIAVPYPATSIERDYAYAKHHPVAEAYIARNPPPHNRPTWDLTSVLYAVQPDRGYFDLSGPGTAVVEKDGYTRFEPKADGRHRYLILSTPEQKARLTEALVQLSSQPPCVRK